ncbi:hypothetical protein A9G34_01085 [Gilliamella sp. Choc4-2]|uniref:gp53-like domain-containing protein n=1 Tax=unclassified Gilliamella TaxID=2685620 RepID=UPI00080E29FF|nr:hypothetical protein [Gilliamella apicola]OCG45725.1 hypothetical protein A9G34_01085 [Gilliamella apicola]OCG65002.1 hypothetical protein A9G48_01125 [Gilliamella apicola]
MKIQKKPDYLIFADSAKTGEISDFPDVNRGWGITIEQTASKPPMEWMNGAFNRIDKNMLYLLQQGVPEWSETVKYPVNAMIKYNGILYTAIAENDNAKPSTSATKWTTLINGKYLPANKLNDIQYEVTVETYFKQRPKFDNSGMVVLNDFESRHSTNGYQKLPSGLIIQWCSSITNSTGSLTLTLPIAFPNNLFNVVVAEANGDGWDNRTAYSYGYVLGKSSRSTIKILSRVINPGSVIGAAGRFSLIAIGN